MKKQNWLLNNLYLVCAILWYVVAAMKYFNGTSGAVTWFCFGCLYLCLQANQIMHRAKENSDRENRPE